VSRRYTPCSRATHSVISAAMALAGCGPTDHTSAPAASFSGAVATDTPIGPAGVDVRAHAATAIGKPVKSPAVTQPRPHPCTLQDGKRLDITPKLASGTEPFWSARIDGRCVLYVTPENVQGIRIWTRYRSDADGEVWSGALDGRPFQLVLQPHRRCSDGMSDEIYPMAARLIINNQRRVGCARPGRSGSRS